MCILTKHLDAVVLPTKWLCAGKRKRAVAAAAAAQDSSDSDDAPAAETEEGTEQTHKRTQCLQLFPNMRYIVVWIMHNSTSQQFHTIW
jgi:hypothetical protein